MSKKKFIGKIGIWILLLAIIFCLIPEDHVVKIIVKAFLKAILEILQDIAKLIKFIT